MPSSSLSWALSTQSNGLVFVWFFALCFAAGQPQSLLVTGFELVKEFGPQLANMAVLYLFLGVLNKRSRRLGDKAARQVSKLAPTLLAFQSFCPTDPSFRSA